MTTPSILLGLAVLLLSVNGLVMSRKLNDVTDLLGTQHEINEEQDKVNQQVKAALEHILAKEGANVPK